MSATRTFNVNSSTYTAVTVQGPGPCGTITVYEDDQAGTTDYYVSRTGQDSDKVTKPAGSKKEFKANHLYYINDVVGYIKTASGSVTFAQEEEGA